MTYIFLIAGKGNRLQPLTLKMPKSMYKLDKDTTVLERMIALIEEKDENAHFVVVVGFMADEIKKRLADKKNITFIVNPFYGITNSIASLWFARDYMDEEVTIINGDIVMEKKLVHDVVCATADRPYVLVDQSIKNNGDYNVQVLDKSVLVMSKNLDEYFGEYAGVTKLDKQSALKVKNQIEKMVGMEMYDQWYENALVQMIFDDDFKLEFEDISDYKWTEIDCVDDMLLAKQIHSKENER